MQCECRESLATGIDAIVADGRASIVSLSYGKCLLPGEYILQDEVDAGTLSFAAAAAAASLAPVAASAAERSEPSNTSATADTPAQIRAFEARLLRARPVPLARVRLTGGPLKHAQDLNGTYLLALDPDRMMAYYRVRAGLPKKAEGYTGWDGDKRNLTGHIAGHHLSGVSLMFAATGDTRYKTRADYLVRELKEVQDKNGDGYLGALEGGREAFAAVSKGDIRSGGFDLNGLWSPWYTLHKTFAGLRDALAESRSRVAELQAAAGKRDTFVLHFMATPADTRRREIGEVARRLGILPEAGMRDLRGPETMQ